MFLGHDAVAYYLGLMYGFIVQGRQMPRLLRHAKMIQAKNTTQKQRECLRSERHDVDGASLGVGTRGNGRAELEDNADDVGSGVGHIRNALGDVEAAVAVGLNVALNLHVLLHSWCCTGRHELRPLSGGEHAIRGLVQTTWNVLRLGIGEDRVDVLLKVAVRPRGRAHCGNLSEVGSEGGEVTSAQGSVVHSLAACVGCEGKVGCNPTDGGDETSHAGRATHWRIVRALQAVVVNGLVQEDNGLVQVGGRLDHVDDALCADPGQLLGLGIVEEVLQVAQGLVVPQALSLLDDLVDARDVLPVLNLLHADRMLGTNGQGRVGHGFSQPHHRQHCQHPGSGHVPTGLAFRALG